MSKSLVIAKITLVEVFRDRVFISLFAISLGLMLMSLVLGQLSFAEQTRILAHFGMTSIHLLMLGLSLFLGCFVISREIEKQTYTTLLARPLTRTAFLFGKYLGLVFAVTCSVIALFIVLSLLLHNNSFLQGLAVACLGIIFESLILLSLALFGGSFVKPSSALFFSLGVFLFGYWLPDLAFFAAKSKSEVFLEFAKYVQYVVPNLYVFNWREIGMLETPRAFSSLIWPFFHSLIWSAIFFFATAAIVRRKDLV